MIESMLTHLVCSISRLPSRRPQFLIYWFFQRARPIRIEVLKATHAGCAWPFILNMQFMHTLLAEIM